MVIVKVPCTNEKSIKEIQIKGKTGSIFNKGQNITPFAYKVWRSSPTMYGEELRYMSDAFEMNRDVHRGENINKAERMTA